MISSLLSLTLTISLGIVPFGISIESILQMKQLRLSKVKFIELEVVESGT